MKRFLAALIILVLMTGCMLPVTAMAGMKTQMDVTVSLNTLHILGGLLPQNTIEAVRGLLDLLRVELRYEMDAELGLLADVALVCQDEPVASVRIAYQTDGVAVSSSLLPAGWWYVAYEQFDQFAPGLGDSMRDMCTKIFVSDAKRQSALKAQKIIMMGIPTLRAEMGKVFADWLAQDTTDIKKEDGALGQDYRFVLTPQRIQTLLNALIDRAADSSAIKAMDAYTLQTARTGTPSASESLLALKDSVAELIEEGIFHDVVAGDAHVDADGGNAHARAYAFYGPYQEGAMKVNFSREVSGNCTVYTTDLVAQSMLDADRISAEMELRMFAPEMSRVRKQATLKLTTGQFGGMQMLALLDTRERPVGPEDIDQTFVQVNATVEPTGEPPISLLLDWMSRSNLPGPVDPLHANMTQVVTLGVRQGDPYASGTDVQFRVATDIRNEMADVQPQMPLPEEMKNLLNMSEEEKRAFGAYVSLRGEQVGMDILSRLPLEQYRLLTGR